MSEPLLSVENLQKHYPVRTGLLGREVERVRAVGSVDFEIEPGETLGLVGESGCGKSTVASTTLRLEEPTAGTIQFDGDDVTAFGPDDLTRFRRRAQLVFQDPNTTFNPRLSVAETVGEPLRIHGMADPDRRRAIVSDLLDRVGLSGVDVDRYPRAFSGGQKQRIALARALVLDPDLLVADEPVSGLDVSVQAQVLDLMADLQAAFDLSILFISHDMRVVREFADRIAVMYLGEIVERGPIEDVFANPAHPYTRALLDAIPSLGRREEAPPAPLSGDVPDPAHPPSGCRFHTRCPVIIPPEGVDLDEETWRSIVDLRMALAGDANAQGFLAELHADSRAGASAAAAASSMDETVRATFDLPESLADPVADATLTDAIEHLEAGAVDAAVERLQETFKSPCERGRSAADDRVRERPRVDGSGTYRCKRPH